MTSEENHPRFTPLHLWILGSSFMLVAAFVLLATGSLASAGGVLLGPFAGGFARDWQECCAENSMSLAPYAIGFFASGFLAQLAPTSSPWIRVLRYLFWSLGCSAWFLLALVSYLHALE